MVLLVLAIANPGILSYATLKEKIRCPRGTLSSQSRQGYGFFLEETRLDITAWPASMDISFIVMVLFGDSIGQTTASR